MLSLQTAASRGRATQACRVLHDGNGCLQGVDETNVSNLYIYRFKYDYISTFNTIRYDSWLHTPYVISLCTRPAKIRQTLTLDEAKVKQAKRDKKVPAPLGSAALCA